VQPKWGSDVLFCMLKRTKCILLASAMHCAGGRVSVDDRGNTAIYGREVTPAQVPFSFGCFIVGWAVVQTDRHDRHNHSC
jgi:hypothetical protein